MGSVLSLDITHHDGKLNHFLLLLSMEEWSVSWYRSLYTRLFLPILSRQIRSVTLMTLNIFHSSCFGIWRPLRESNPFIFFFIFFLDNTGRDAVLWSKLTTGDLKVIPERRGNLFSLSSPHSDSLVPDFAVWHLRISNLAEAYINLQEKPNPTAIITASIYHHFSFKTDVTCSDGEYLMIKELYFYKLFDLRNLECPTDVM